MNTYDFACTTANTMHLNYVILYKTCSFFGVLTNVKRELQKLECLLHSLDPDIVSTECAKFRNTTQQEKNRLNKRKKYKFKCPNMTESYNNPET